MSRELTTHDVEGELFDLRREASFDFSHSQICFFEIASKVQFLGIVDLVSSFSESVDGNIDSHVVSGSNVVPFVEVSSLPAAQIQHRKCCFLEGDILSGFGLGSVFENENEFDPVVEFA